MVITEEESAKTPIGPPGTELPGPSASQNTPLLGESPPSYYGVSSQPAYQPQGPPQPYPVQEYTVIVYRYGQSPGVRFLRAFLVAWLIWILCTAFVQSTIMAAHWRHPHRPGPGPGRGHGGRIDGGWEYNIPSGLLMSGCVQGGDWSNQVQPATFYTELPAGNPFLPPHGFPFSSQTTFDVPLDSVNLLLLSRGQLSAGTVDVVTSPQQAPNTATFRVVMNYFREDIRNLAKVCVIRRNEGESTKGVGIFTPTWRTGRHDRKDEQMYFETTLILPEVDAHAAPLSIKGFETDAPNTLHRFGDLNTKVLFGSISLRGSNAPIHAKSLSAITGDVHTTNGFIRGIFNTSGSLMLTTTNSPIDVDVGLESTEGSAPELTALTTNGAIQAAISLTTTAPSNQGGSYAVSLTTTNGNLQVRIPSQPVNSSLHLTATTSNGPANMVLNPAYEGTFSLQSPTAVVVRERKGIEDPSGEHRRRRVRYNMVGKFTQGDVRWGTEGEARTRTGIGRNTGTGLHGDGTILIRTTNAPVTFDF
ncbi:hypothetical protein BDZ97DRAFT_1835763 [Flammula alnicola]|nr:hypothetical protein BDZ97DRAFT_1835763 [Flammula alnicola]